MSKYKIYFNCIRYSIWYGQFKRKKNVIEILKSKDLKDQNVANEIELKVDIKYMILINVNTADGLVNGAIGTLMHISTDQLYGLPIILWIKFDSERVGILTRNNSDYLYQAYHINKELNWIPILPFEYNYVNMSKKNITVRRKQFPVTIAEGCTIHKIQGSTFEKIVVHVICKINTKKRQYEKELSRELKYVAISRAKTLAGALNIILISYYREWSLRSI
jgi:ATP-dependent exoDNAse (exonuclease V) alpha subunit